MKQNLHAKMTLRLYTDEKCFGPGVAALLRQVEQLHSLRSAAQSMGMAYSKAWKIIRQCESGLGFSLLSSTAGGKGGGGAVLTSEGKALLDAYEAYCADLEAVSQQLFQKHMKDLL